MRATKIFLCTMLMMLIPLSIGIPTINAQALANEAVEYEEGKIVEKEETDCEFSESSTCYEYTVELTTGANVNTEIMISEAGDMYSYGIGDPVFLMVREFEGITDYVITGPIRDRALLFVVALFILVTVAVGGKQGIGSLIGLATSILVLFGGVIPAILGGADPILVGFLGACAVLTVSIFLSHGFNSKSLIALISTFLGLTVVSILALLFIALTKLNGFGEEESYFLLNQADTLLNMKGILFASIIVAGVGIMDDVTVNQVSSLQEVYKANPSMSQAELFKSTMTIGKDHIASMVNTLFIAYAGASMPLVMLMSLNNVSLRMLVNHELFAEEIIRTFIGSIGLIIIVPITSYFASALIKSPNKPKWLFRDFQPTSLEHGRRVSDSRSQ